ncbi:MAG TPA: hypothetical protein VM490_26055 [Armatimonadaceae bacterium]|nr:hypothetical protein [Armatimonadaceae bacterium]
MWDVSAFVGAWPFRRLDDARSPGTLEARLRRWGVTRGAFVSPLDALFAADPMPANAAWAERLAGPAFFRLVPVLNPALPGWERALEEGVPALPGGAAIRAVRLLPGYQGCAPDAEAARDLTRRAGAAGLAVIVQAQMQDARGAHPLARVPDADPRAILTLARACPETTVVAAGVRWGAANALAREAAEGGDGTPRLFIETSHLEYVDPIRRFLDEFGAARLLAGSHAPILTPAALRMKLDAARLTPEERDAITDGNLKKAGLLL